ncbi:MAG TPA: hypothetical protein VFZ09_31990 [Archangium sp.]|uniref:hypothetical protein n=1 Tax=Archangium sp. TaxID=1872627 RepID=UPI002E34D5B5|nr:hypothetical protein [Archangium sp.]HEX5750890.1 hypothetical protein [Archangium sp.]
MPGASLGELAIPTRTLAQRLVASLLSLLLVSCSATRPITQEPTSPLDLGKYVLVIQEMPDGQVTHEWRPLENFDLTKFPSTASARSAYRGLVRVSSEGLEAYCEGRREQCEQDCLASNRPVQVGHWRYENTKERPWRDAKWRWCPEHCMKQADLCKRKRGNWAEEHAAEFNAIEPAVDWIKTHRDELLAGTLIVIAGVAFVVASGGGLLLLMPLVYVAESSPGLREAPPISEMTR